MDVQPQWTRETPWRQGYVLSAEAARILGLANATDAHATCVVVVSHDCDLANANLDVEPEVEVIVGRIVPAANGNFSWGKAPRTLHLPIERDGVLVIVELVATSRCSVPKSVLAKSEPDRAFIPDGMGLAVLRSWLSARYSRAAFPDTFASRMSATKLDERLAKIVAQHGQLISFVYFDLDGGKSIERPDSDPYEFSIVLVYPPGEDPDESAATADKVAEAVEEACAARLNDGKNIVLKSCFALSEEDISISSARLLTHWRFEHLSLRADDEQPGPVAV